MFRQAFRDGAKVVQAAAKANAPHRTGALKRSIKVRSHRRSRVRFGVEVRTGTREELGIPADAPGYYPMSIETGWTFRGGTTVPARPFLRPAFDQNKEKVVEAIRKKLGAAVAKEWARGR